MRFRKSIRIAKGVRVNFSKSGLSLSAGIRGASVSIGSKGAYLNTGLPGTGLSNRTKIYGASSDRNYSTASSGQTQQISIQLVIDDNGQYLIKDNNGQIITDESLLRKIKRSDLYKNKILELSEQFANEKNAETDTFVEIYKQSEDIILEAEVKNKLSSLKPQIYIKREYDGPKPNEIIIKTDLESEAKRKISTLAFWKIKKLRKAFVDEQFPVQLQKETDKYLKSVSDFNEKEIIIEAEKNREFINIFLMEKKYLEDFLSGKKEFVESSIDSFLESMTLPVNFEVSYEYEEDKGLLVVDLDLPEIEDLPTSKATTLSSGKVKVKEKTQKEIKEQYLICVTGLAFFFSSHLFNISTNIKEILISGYTQRISKKTGTMNDDYIYSIKISRDKIEQMNIKNIIPYIAFEQFQNNLNYNKTFELQTIEPINS